MQSFAAVFVVTPVVVKLAMMANKKRYKLPPGPRGLPLVGYLPFFGKDPPVTFMELRKTYGDVISIRMGSWPTIVINGREAIREALVTKGDDFSGRPAFTSAILLSDGRNFAFSVFGAVWKAQRKIVSNVMYNFTNVHNNPIEDTIRSDANTVIEEFLRNKGKAFCPLNSLEVASSSMVYQLCFGRHQNIRENKHFMQVLDGSREFEKFNGAGNPVDVMPWLRYVLPSRVAKFQQLNLGNEGGMEEKVKEHETDFDSDSLRDITDGLIHAGNTLSAEEKAVGLDKHRGSRPSAPYSERLAAQLPTHFSGSWDSWPPIQTSRKKLFQQIDEVVGQSREASMSDRPQLPMVDAAIYEVLRYAAGLPFALPHATTRDTTLQGYDIPEGTVVLVNLQSIHMDKDLWRDPETFRPERFLDGEGQLDKGLVEQVSVFSLGRRRCVGEVLAKMEMFLFLTTLIQRVLFCRPPGQPQYHFISRYGLSRDINPYDVFLYAR